MSRILILILMVLSVCSVSAQNKTASLQEAERANVEAVKLFAQKKYDEAEPLARKAVALFERELGASDLQTARARRNLAFIEIGRGDKRAAEDAFDRAVEAFEKNSNLERKDSLQLAEMLQYLGALKNAVGKPQAAEKNLERAVELREKLQGADASETVNSKLSLANVKRFAGKHKEVAEIYRSIYENRLQRSGADDAETRDIFGRYTCALRKIGKEAEAEKLKAEYAALQKEKASAEGTPKSIEGGVVNSRAINLVKPPYTSEARSARFSGTIQITVTINENGDVIHACASSSKAPLAQIEATEAAAWQSKFTPTLLSGKPVKVTGVIVYNFQL